MRLISPLTQMNLATFFLGPDIKNSRCAAQMCSNILIIMNGQRADRPNNESAPVRHITAAVVTL